jgi:uncharacterized surface protein with fasciclin (FAS1) repeats
MRKTMIVLFSALLLTFGGFASSASAQEDPGTIVDVASGNPDFSTLVAAVDAAGLVETLSGPGPFTVFAPNNAAFEKLPAGTVDALLADPTGDLTAILQLHVVSGEISSEQAIAAAGTNIDTLGGPVAVALDGETLTVGGAAVIATDIPASNGVIHVIDTVITPDTAVPAAPTAEPAPAPAATAPTAVNSGDSGLAAESTTNLGLLALIGAVALVGLGTSSFALVKVRRDS